MKEEKKLRFYRKKGFWVIAFITLAIAGFSYFKILSSKDGAVTSTEVKRGTVEEVLTLSGEINADEYARLTFPASGEIAWVGVSEGQEVKKDQALTKLDTVVLNSAFQTARATLRAAEATVANIHDQVKDHSGDETFVQKDTRTTAEATKDKAYEAYVAAEYNLRNSTITSPFSGIITYLAHAYPGVNIIYTETQVEVINPGSIYFEVAGDQSEVINVFKDQKVNIVLDSLPEENLEGIVNFVGYTPKAGEAGTVYKIKVKFLKDSFDFNKFRIGMSGDAKFILSKKDNVLYLPLKYINTDAKGKYVNLGSSNNKVYVQIGVEGEDSTEIISDKIKEGDVLYD